MTSPTSPNPPPAGPTEVPHFTKELLIDAMRHLSSDFAASMSGEADDDRARSRLEHARRIGLDKLGAEAIARMEQATKDVRELVWPGGLDQRYLGLVGTVETLARISTELLPHDDKHAHLSALAPVMQRALVASGSNLRAKRTQALRGIHVIIDPAATNGQGAGWVAEQALLGGATALQLNAGTLEKGDWYILALRLRELCDSTGAALLIASHPDVAVAVGADGVHLGPHDLPLAAARKVLAPWQIAGVAGATVDDAQTAFELGADYVSVGDVLTLRSVRELMPVGGPPLIATGDVTRENVAEIVAAGADAICAGETLTGDNDPKLATINLLLNFRNAP